MPSREKRAMRRQRGSAVLPILIVLLALAAAVLVLILMRSNPLAAPQSEHAAGIYPENPNFVDQGKSTAAPLVLSAASSTPDLEPQSTSRPEIEPTQAPMNAADAAETPKPEGSARWIPAAMNGDYFLPVFDRALRTPSDEAMIAITVDDCNNGEVLSQIVEIARRYGVKLTLFPTGEALMNPDLSDGFRTCVRKYGYELENHTYSHKGEYRLSNGELAIQLWKQSIAASYVVGADYEQHFFRPVYDNSKYDQRTHFFIRKLGYQGVASYTYSYKSMTAENMTDTLKNGNIYQFDMTEKSMELFEPFIREASRRGYRLVTMNELFGLNEDVVGRSLSIDQQTLPTMDDYVSTYYDLKLNYRTQAVYSLQARLAELGYLTGDDAKPDGLYGPNTSIAVSALQAKIGVAATGNATVETQERLFALNAPLAG